MKNAGGKTRFEKQLPYVIGLLVLGLSLIAIYLSWSAYLHRDDSEISYGVTFSTKYAKELGIDWQAAYLASLKDLEIQRYRIPVYWDEIEKEPGRYDLSEVQWMVDRAAEHDAEIILAIGERVPRWPECHPPQWARELWYEDRREAELQMIEHVVEQFRRNKTVRVWQVQNEPLLPNFGDCPKPNIDHIRATVQKVRDTDNLRPIMMTDSGELSEWVRIADLADVIGVSMYRRTWNKYFGYFQYPLPVEYYYFKRRAVEPLVEDAIVSELQAEPWPPGVPVSSISVQEQYRSMNPQRFLGNVDYAQRTGFDTVYMWGVEWWWYLKEHAQEPEMWETAKQVIAAKEE